MLAVRAPQSKPAEDRLVDLQRVHQRDRVEREGRLLAVAAVIAERKRVVP